MKDKDAVDALGTVTINDGIKEMGNRIFEQSKGK
jgi:hypothetical protein